MEKSPKIQRSQDNNKGGELSIENKETKHVLKNRNGEIEEGSAVKFEFSGADRIDSASEGILAFDKGKFSILFRRKDPDHENEMDNLEIDSLGEEYHGVSISTIKKMSQEDYNRHQKFEDKVNEEFKRHSDTIDKINKEYK